MHRPITPSPLSRPPTEYIPGTARPGVIYNPAPVSEGQIVPDPTALQPRVRRSPAVHLLNRLRTRRPWRPRTGGAKVAAATRTTHGCRCEGDSNTTVILLVLATVCATVSTLSLLVAAAKGWY